jgi:predicted Zn finger-like uncharacterized protein
MALEISCPGCKSALRIREEHAGKRLKCPRCSTVISVPASTDTVEQPVEHVRPAPRVSSPRSAPASAGDEITVQEVRPDGAATGTRRCPHCGERIAASANRCRYCRAWLDEDEDEEEPRPRKRRSFKPCPKCGASEAQRVTWTPWGSFYGPALFTHVRCRECGYGYNGRTGRSNLIPAIFMVAIPAILIVGIVVALLFVLGVFGARRW